MYYMNPYQTSEHKSTEVDQSTRAHNTAIPKAGRQPSYIKQPSLTHPHPSSDIFPDNQPDNLTLCIDNIFPAPIEWLQLGRDNAVLRAQGGVG